MAATDIPTTLWVWTPFLAEGFMWNIIISLAAMAIGSVLGVLLGLARASSRHRLIRLGSGVTHLSRNVPTFVFMFYLAYLIPFEVQFGEQVWSVPPWMKASLALSVAVVGFVSDNFLAAVRQWRRGDHLAGYLFIPNWTMYFAIIVMASSTASVIGVSELVARCNTVIGATGNDSLMMWIYLYAMLWFFVFSLAVTTLMHRVRVRLERRTLLSAAAA
jgi:polar amino acid transport system permease protein